MIVPEWWREELGVTWRSDSSLPGSYKVSLPQRSFRSQASSRPMAPMVRTLISVLKVPSTSNGMTCYFSGDELPGPIGSILKTNGIPKMLPNDTWVPTSSLRISISLVGLMDKEMFLHLPKRYPPFLKLFSRTTAQKLPATHTFDV